MISVWRVLTIYVMVLTILPQIAVQNLNNHLDYRPFFIERRLQDVLPHLTDEENVRHIDSMMNAFTHRGDSEKEFVTENNVLEDTKYRPWKRNADLINSLLGLPKGMGEAGR